MRYFFNKIQQSSIVAWAIVVLLWAIAYLYVNNPLLIPSPLETIITFGELFGTPKFINYLSNSLYDLLTGWIVAMLVLALVSLLMLMSIRFSDYMRNIAAGWQATPTFAVAPVVLTIFGYSRTSALVMLVWGVIWYAIMHLASDINEAKRNWQKQIANIQWGYLKQWRNVYIPAILPRFLIVAKNAWAMMWRILIAIEVLFGSISGGYGLGSWMMETKVDYALTETWSILIVIIAAGITINKMFDLIIKRIDW